MPSTVSGRSHFIQYSLATRIQLLVYLVDYYGRPQNTLGLRYHQGTALFVAVLIFLSNCHQSPDIVVPDQAESHTDIERASGSTSLIPGDPYQIRDGIIADEELAGLRSRKKGKAIAKYQSRQNNVRHAAAAATYLPFMLINISYTAHLSTAEAYG